MKSLHTPGNPRCAAEHLDALICLKASNDLGRTGRGSSGFNRERNYMWGQQITSHVTCSFQSSCELCTLEVLK